MGKIIDRDKNKRRIFPLDTPKMEASIHKIDLYAKRIQKAEQLNVILIALNGLILLGVLIYVNI